MNIARPDPRAPLQRGKRRLQPCGLASYMQESLPVENFRVRQAPCHSLLYPLIVSKYPYFLESDDVVFGIGKFMCDGLYALFEFLCNIFKTPEQRDQRTGMYEE